MPERFLVISTRHRVNNTMILAKDLKYPSLTEEYCSLCEKYRDKLLPEKSEWTKRLRFTSAFEPYVLNKLSEILMYRFSNEADKLFKTDFPLKQKRFYTILNDEITDIYYVTSETSLQTTGIEEAGESESAFMDYITHGLCEQEYLDCLSTFESTFIAASALISDSPMNDGVKVGEVVKNDLMREICLKDPSFFEASKSTLVEFLKDALLYSETGVQAIIFSNAYAASFKKWQKESECKDPLVECVNKSISNLTDALCAIGMLDNCFFTYTTDKYLHYCFIYAWDDENDLSIDAKFRYPHFLFDCLILDMGLQVLNDKYHFCNKEKEEMVHGSITFK